MALARRPSVCRFLRWVDRSLGVRRGMLVAPWLGVSTAALAAPSTWPEVVEALASPYALRSTPDELQGPLAALCGDGVAGACGLQEGTPERVLPASCKDGDDVACLGAAWLEAVDDVVPILAAHCESGRAAACASLATARIEGRGTWRSRRLGTMAAESVCAEGHPEGCLLLAELMGPARPAARRRWLERALELGGGLAAGRLAAMDEPSKERTGALEAACEAGDGASCMRVAREAAPDARDPLVARACALGDAEGCLARVVQKVEEGSMSVAAARRALAPSCERGLGAACFGARAYQLGGRPILWTEGELPEVRDAEILLPHNQQVGDCHRAAIDGGADVVLDLDLVMDFASDGTIVAVVPGTDDDELAGCIVGVFLGYDTLGPAGGPARAPLRARAHLMGAPRRTRGEGDVDAVDDMLRALAEGRGLAVERCYIEHGGSAFDRVFLRLDAKLAPDGELEILSVLESSGDASTDACVVALLDDWASPTRQPSYPATFVVHVDFNVVSLAVLPR